MASQPFLIDRLFDAPIALVWRAWTEQDRLMRWFGPKGFTMPSSKLDLRPGGTFHYCLRGPDGSDMWGLWTIREIDPPRRLVLVDAFSDAKGGLTRHPMAPTWPRELMTTITLEEVGSRTRLSIRWEPFHASSEEQATFDASHASMNQGWSGTLEQLETYLTTL